MVAKRKRKIEAMISVLFVSFFIAIIFSVISTTGLMGTQAQVSAIWQRGIIFGVIAIPQILAWFFA